MRDWIRANRQLLLRGLGTLLGLGLLIFLLAEQGWQEIAAAMRQISAGQLLLAFALVLLSRFFVIGRWHVLMRSGGVPIPLQRSSALTFTGLFASNFLPTTIGGDVLRMAGAMQMGYDRAVCLAAIATDRLVGMAGMLMVLPLGLVPLGQTLAASQALAIPTIWQRGKGFLRRTLAVMAIWLRKPGSLAASLGCTWGHMLCTFAATAVLLSGLGEHVSFSLIAGLWSVAYFITLIPISINGYGLQELSISWLFHNVAGLSLTDSLVLALLMRLLAMLASLPGAFYLPSVLAAMDRSSK
jgi:glycosyltransferase 2 family protein